MIYKKIFPIFFVSVLLLMGQFNTAFGQQPDSLSVADQRKIDSLADVLVVAHRTFKKLSDEVTKQAETSWQKSLAVKTDSIFKARRGVINALINNLYLLPENQKKIAFENFNSYLTASHTAAKVLQKKEKGNAAADFASSMNKSNKKVFDSLNFISANGDTNVAIEVRPDNFLNMRITYATNVNKSDFIIYLFPTVWINKSNRLASCYLNNWNNMPSCPNILLTHNWKFGDNQKIDYIFSGKYTVMLYNKALNSAIYLQPVIIPLATTYAYTIN
jgi:hypothetical protein